MIRFAGSLMWSGEVEIPINDASFEEPVEMVNEHLQKLGADYFVKAAENVQIHDGMQFAVVGGGDDPSTESALIMPAPFANGAWSHILARAEAVSYLAGEAGMRDANGNLIPVVVTASPSIRSSYGLTKNELHQVAVGNYAPVAERQLGAISKARFGKIAGVVGYSQGGVMVYPTMVSGNPNFDVEGKAVMGEPPHVAERSLGTLGINFMIEGGKFKKELTAEAITVVDELFATKRAQQSFYSGVKKTWRENLAIAKGFTSDALKRDLAMLARNNIDTTLIHASDSAITPRDIVIDSFRWARDFAHAYSQAYPQYGEAGRMRRYEVTGTNHAFGDRVGRFATLAAASLL